ncbi:MAG: VanZ family protein [Balneolaceae bacterium]|nr:VanZ family protein [Balneolaceae bacterium]
MPKPTSKKERNYWIAAFTVVATIYATLGLAGSLADVFIEKQLFTYLFVGCFVVTGMVMIGFGISKNVRLSNWLIYLTIFVGLVMLFTRSGISPAERTHLFEYGLVGVLIFNAIKERYHNLLKAALLAFIITVLFGIIDECLQYFLPNRVFDTLDIIRNTVAAFIGVFVSLLMVLMSSRIHPEIEKPE